MLGALLTSSLTRIIPIGMMLLALQKTLFVELQPFGVIIQIVLAFAASAGAAGGRNAGSFGRSRPLECPRKLFSAPPRGPASGGASSCLWHAA